MADNELAHERVSGNFCRRQRRNHVPTASKPADRMDRPPPQASSETKPLDDLVAACRNGDREAQHLLYDCCHERVYRLAVRLVGLGDASDVLQQVFLQVLLRLRQFQGHSRFETWLFRVTVNESLQHLRMKKRRRWVSVESDFMDGQPNHEDAHNHKELMACALERLEPELRSLFLLREVEKQSYAEISESLGIPEGTVASRLSRARLLLKQYLVELGWEP